MHATRCLGPRMISSVHMGHVAVLSCAVLRCASASASVGGSAERRGACAVLNRLNALALATYGVSAGGTQGRDRH